MDDLLMEARQLEDDLDEIEREYRRFYSEYQTLLNNIRFNCRDCQRGARTGFRNRIDLSRYEVCDINGQSCTVPAGHCINCITLGYECMKILQRLEKMDIELTEQLNDIQDSLNYRW